MAAAVIPPVNPGRIRILSPAAPAPGSKPGPVVYWMFRDQRSADNWALIHALHLSAASSAPVAVAFNLFHRFLGAHARQLGFMLRGLRQLAGRLDALNIPFFLLRGDAVFTIPEFVRVCGASTLVTDFSPLRPVREQKEEIVRRVGPAVGVHEVDAHNVVSVWAASAKLEYSARTIRAKIHRLLPEYLVEFPEVKGSELEWTGARPPVIDWDALIAEVLSEGEEVPELGWCEPGEDAAMEVLMGSNDGFLTKRLRNYNTDRNSPLKPKALSGLSPYLHFGQISAQRCALNAKPFRNSNPQGTSFNGEREKRREVSWLGSMIIEALNLFILAGAIDAFLEELIIRRELADNFCYYQPQYDSLQGAWEWARKTLMDHAADKREHLYTKEQLEKAKTADHLWNASQLEMVHHGKMHGFMRMYWAKKILEWTSSPEEALSIAIYLNDKYQIDGRDPNGYVGCMWSICGVHDQGWKERPVFGKIRYMNYAGCKRKFDVDGYIAYVDRLVGETKKRKLSNPSSLTTKQSRTTESRIKL